MKKSQSQRDISCSNYISNGLNSPCQDKNKSIPPVEVENGDLFTPQHQLNKPDYNSSFEKLRIQLTQSSIQSKRERLDQEEAKVKKEKEHRELLICKSQRIIREGFTNFDIINFSKKESLMPVKLEKLGKKFDYNGGQYHNYQTSFLKKIEDNKQIFFRNNGICAQKINNSQNHQFISNPLKKI